MAKRATFDFRVEVRESAITQGWRARLFVKTSDATMKEVAHGEVASTLIGALSDQLRRLPAIADALVYEAETTLEADDEKLTALEGAPSRPTSPPGSSSPAG